MKYVFLLILSNITFSSFSQGINIVERLWGDCKKPLLTEIKYTEEGNVLKINYSGEIEIVIHSYNDDRQLVEVNRINKTLFSFFSKYIINPRYLSGVYEIELFPKSHIILLVAYPEGASGLSANTTFGVLFDLDNCMYQYISTWGMVDKNFIDINNNGIFEFVSVDYYVSNNNDSKLVANVFSPNSHRLYVLNNSLNNNVFILFFSDLRIERLDWKQSEIELMKTPDIFERNKYGTLAETPG